MMLSKFSGILNSLYTDKMSVKRYVETINEDGTTDSSLSANVVYADVACRISFGSADLPESSKEDTNPKNLFIKIFCDVSTDIQKGDQIVVNRVGDNGNVLSTYTGTASLPTQFATHKEFSILQNGDA